MLVGILKQSRDESRTTSSRRCTSTDSYVGVLYVACAHVSGVANVTPVQPRYASTRMLIGP